MPVWLTQLCLAHIGGNYVDADICVGAGALQHVTELGHCCNFPLSNNVLCMSSLPSLSGHGSMTDDQSIAEPDSPKQHQWNADSNFSMRAVVLVVRHASAGRPAQQAGVTMCALAVVAQRVCPRQRMVFFR